MTPSASSPTRGRPSHTDLGQGSEYAAGLLTFWKDRYYVSILAYPETPATRDIVFQLGRAIAGAIPNEGPLPPILDRLPAEGLMPETVRYFHHYIWLNSFLFRVQRQRPEHRKGHARRPGQVPAGGSDLFPPAHPVPGCRPGRDRRRPLPARRYSAAPRTGCARSATAAGPGSESTAPWSAWFSAPRTRRPSGTPWREIKP